MYDGIYCELGYSIEEDSTDASAYLDLGRIYEKEGTLPWVSHVTDFYNSLSRVGRPNDFQQIESFVSKL
jgi:hypothetical protein